MKRAVILLSGGLDSSTVLAMAKAAGYDCYAISFDYGQRHRSELQASTNIARAIGVTQHKIVNIDLSAIGGSALTDTSIAMPEQLEEGIPVTYVPARNTVFMSIALGWAEVLQAESIFVGVNAIDYSGYPDCRPEYIAAFEKMANLATKSGVEGHLLSIKTPLIDLSKQQIVEKGLALGVDYSLTVSCYQADVNGRACGKCDSCHFRRQGFAQANTADPTLYQ